MASGARLRWLTYCGLGVVACTSADLVHEVVGHLFAARLVGDPILLLSTIAIQTAGPSRIVSAAGTAANLLVGVLALTLLSRAARKPDWRCFLALFAAFNLLNSGYLVASALLHNGDWAAVIQGLTPFWLWRALLGVSGVAIYVFSLAWLARSMADLVAHVDLARVELRRLLIASYVAGGCVMTLASVFNPIGPQLILLSGVGASFALSAGLLALPGLAAKQLAARNAAPNQRAASLLSPLWIVAGVVWAGIFVGVFGPGIHFNPG